MTESERAWIEEEWWSNPFSDAFTYPNMPVLIYEIPVIQTLDGEFVAIH